jgi:hypothetical protein
MGIRLRSREFGNRPTLRGALRPAFTNETLMCCQNRLSPATPVKTPVLPIDESGLSVGCGAN